jgi:hypothetical protein
MADRKRKRTFRLLCRSAALGAARGVGIACGSSFATWLIWWLQTPTTEVEFSGLGRGVSG